MKRHKSFDLSKKNSLDAHKKKIAYYESGRAVAMLINNQLKNLPPVFFEITFNNNTQNTPSDTQLDLASDVDYSAKVKGGRLVKNLPESIAMFTSELDLFLEYSMEQKEKIIEGLVMAMECDLVNILVGSLAEAKYTVLCDDEIFNKNIVNINALHNYVGLSDRVLIEEYLTCFSNSKRLQNHILERLFMQAYDFIDNASNWKKIMKLVDHILDEDIKKINYNQVNKLLDSKDAS